MPGYLIIGGTGSLGQKLIQRLLAPTYAPQVAVYSRDESKHWTIANQLAEHPNKGLLKFHVGDIRDKGRLKDVIRRTMPDVIIVAAALKHVDTCELTPFESVQTNLLGTQNVIEVVNENSGFLDGRQPDKHYSPTVLFVSTDKACAPVNVYGMCKAVSERMITSQANYGSSVKFLCTRYGNVLESRGSIIPLFKYQAEHAEHLTVTDPEMTRFAMTLDQSVDLIDHALERGKNGETWIPRLPAMRIGDLADIFSRRYSKPIKVIGLRPGEKKHEDLINESESARTKSTSDGKHYVIGPAFDAGSGTSFTYSSSDDVMTPHELEAYLDRLGILSAPLSQFKGQTIEEIVTNRKS